MRTPKIQSTEEVLSKYLLYFTKSFPTWQELILPSDIDGLNNCKENICCHVTDIIRHPMASFDKRTFLQ